TLPPTRIGTVTVPRGPAPPTSSRARVAVISEPQLPPETNENGRDTGDPTGPTTPYACGGPGASTPFPGRSVATRLVVAPVPMLRNGRLTVTSSSRSGAPLAGWHDSLTTETGGTETTEAVPPWNGQQRGRSRAIRN